MKTRDKVFLTFVIAFMLFLIVWCICDVWNTNFYNYQGYVIDIDQNGKKQTVITTVSGDKTSEFVLKWHSLKKYGKDTREIAIDDLVALSTTKFSNTNIKKISVKNGYSTTGKLVYINELDTPFILAVDPSLKTNYLIRVVYFEGNINGITGETIRIYHGTPHIKICDRLIVITTDAYTKVDDISDTGLTEEEISFVESMGYTVKE